MDNRKLKIIAFGEILWDVIDDRYHLGGAPLNFAAHAVQCGSESAIISCVGNDKLGNQALEEISKKDVNISLIERSDVKKTGVVNVSLYEGQPEYEIVKDVAYDFITTEGLDTDQFNDVSAFYIGTLAQRNEVSSATLNYILKNFKFDTIFYDVNLRKGTYDKDIIENSLQYTHVLKVNEVEVEVLGYLLYKKHLDFELFSKLVLSIYPQIRVVIMTAGGDGCFVFDGTKIQHIKSQPVFVEDAIGAGDAFSAAFLTTYLRTQNIVESGQIANKVGGFVASSAGAIPEYEEELADVFR